MWFYNYHIKNKKKKTIFKLLLRQPQKFEELRILIGLETIRPSPTCSNLDFKKAGPASFVALAASVVLYLIFSTLVIEPPRRRRRRRRKNWTFLALRWRLRFLFLQNLKSSPSSVLCCALLVPSLITISENMPKEERSMDSVKTANFPTLLLLLQPSPTENRSWRSQKDRQLYIHCMPQHRRAWWRSKASEFPWDGIENDPIFIPLSVDVGICDFLFMGFYFCSVSMV